jgi:hypothetical protein
MRPLEPAPPVSTLLVKVSNELTFCLQEEEVKVVASLRICGIATFLYAPVSYPYDHELKCI